MAMLEIQMAAAIIAKHMIAALEGSLPPLGTDYVDLLLLALLGPAHTSRRSDAHA